MKKFNWPFMWRKTHERICDEDRAVELKVRMARIDAIRREYEQKLTDQSKVLTNFLSVQLSFPMQPQLDCIEIHAVVRVSNHVFKFTPDETRLNREFGYMIEREIIQQIRALNFTTVKRTIQRRDAEMGSEAGE